MLAHSCNFHTWGKNIVCVWFYDVALSPKQWSDNREKPCILMSRSHCLHIYSHSVEQNTFYLPVQHKHTLVICRFSLLSLRFSISVFSDDVFIGCSFLNEKACFFVCLLWIYDSKTLLKTMLILMFRIFVVQWLFVSSFFVLLMLIKGGGN